MVLALLSGQAAQVGLYYLLFLLIDGAAAALAFRFEGATFGRLWSLIPQRLLYRWLLYVVLVQAYGRALRGQLQSWGAQQRTGRVVLETAEPQSASSVAPAG